MHWNVNENTLTKKKLWVLTNGLLSSKKEVEVGYGKASRDDGNNTQNISLHLLVNVNVVRLKKGTFA
jgi:hypothetical protein